MNKKVKKIKDSEVNAYVYIKNELEKLGFFVKNPARNQEGEVYQQNECLNNEILKKYLERKIPEAVIKIKEQQFWIIESKRDKNELEKALKEARGYAEKLNKDGVLCPLISGIAGNDTDGFIVINQILIDEKWKTILFEENKIKNILLSKKQTQFIFSKDKKEIIKKKNKILYKELPDIPEEKYIEVAEKINEILHNNGINKNKRARFIAGLVLAYSIGDIQRNIENTRTLVQNINNLIEQKLNEVDKENFINFLSLEVPPVQENHLKYRTAIKESLDNLDTLDIKNAINSGRDILGEFYEKFLKYGNGAKEIGIVLTPRHITDFAVKVLNIISKDFIFDPTMGTSGFLVSAFDYVKKTSNRKEIENFKQNNIYGIEMEDEVIALALVNMIFRGDGRNNMSSGNCFYKNIEKNKERTKGEFKENKKEGKSLKIEENENPIITKVLMNPPFALKNNDEKEKNFIDYALKQMEDKGILFAIVPISVMVEGKSGTQWRKELLEKNTLLSVITFPDDLFYPVSVGTIGVFLKKGISHNFEKDNVYFCRATTDGFKKKKGKRIFLENAENKLESIKEELKSFLHNTNLKFKDVPEFKKICLLDKEDKNLELVPEAYLDTKIPTLEELEEGVEEIIREAIAFKVRYYKKLKQTGNL